MYTTMAVPAGYLGSLLYAPVQLTASYQWDNEGRMTTFGAPSPASQQSQYWQVNGLAGSVFAYQFDAMGRLSGMTEDDQLGDGPQTAASASYGPAG